VNEKRKFDRETDEYVGTFSPLHNLYNDLDPISLTVREVRYKQWVLDEIQHYLKAIPHKWMNFNYQVNHYLW
jgi:hypothetical protein